MSEATNTAEEVVATSPAKKKATKPKAEPKPKVVKEVEIPAAMLARLKKEQPSKYGRVTEILEVGKGGSPTRVRIKTDDKTEDGKDQFRDVKPQDLFQVKLSVAGQAKAAKAKRNKSASARRKTAGSTGATKA